MVLPVEERKINGMDDIMVPAPAVVKGV